MNDKLTDEMLNRFIHEKVMGEKCWHRVDWAWAELPQKSKPYKHGEFKCGGCGETVTFVESHSMEDRFSYCTDLNAAARAEAKAIEKFGIRDYASALASPVALSRGPVPTSATYFEAAMVATARQRVQAIYQLYGGQL